MIEAKVVKERVTDKQFVMGCKNCHSTGQAASLLGLSCATVSARANKLRKLGVNLPKFARVVKTKAVDVEGLNDLLDD
jgi:transposase